MGSSDSFGFAWVPSDASMDRRVKSVSRWFSTPRPDVVGFILDHLVSLRHTKQSSGSFRFAWVYSGSPSGRLVYSGSRGLPRTRLDVLGLIRFRVGLLCRS